jgi:pilus assembly protein FimV
VRKTDHRKQFRASILALALALAPWSAEAAGLGRLTLLSALGEPLRAEIELTANNDEYASMAARLASADAFKNAGIEYAPTLAGIRFALERRPNGQPFISVKSERAVNDPFIDMLVEVSWASGRLVREYTFLLDPPELFRSPALAAAPEVKKEAPAPAPVPAQETPPVAAPAGETAAPAPAPEKSAPAPKPAAKPAAPPAKTTAAPEATTRTVNKGDTLGKIASETKPDGVSLDQMLVALFRSNPDAFDGGNMNRLRAGKILGLPDKEAIVAVDPGEARKIVVAQSVDFNAYRRKLAALAAAAPAREEAPRQAVGGKITPRVEEKTAAPTGKDKLEVSRTEAAKAGKPGAAPGRGVTEEDIIARDKALKDAKTRIAELERNLGELRKLAEMRSAAGAKLQEQAQAKKPEPPAAPKPAEAPKPAPAASAEAPKPADAPKPAEAAKPVEAPPAPKPAVAPPPPPPAPISPAEPPPSFVEENPDLVFGGAGILALLLAYFGYNGWRKRRQAAATPASAATVESTASVFGSTGGQSVDTGTALPTDFSQDSTSTSLVADEGIDPVAEADVYMAYGRDRQAEEILLEALKTEPTRTAIHLKLLEIYAARKSLAQFEGVARELFALTGGSGPDWEKAAALGRSLDPANPLYGSAPAAAEQPAGPSAASEADAGMATMIMPAALAQQMAEAPPAEAETPAVEEEPAEEAPLSLDFDLDLGEEPAAAPPVAAEEPPAAEEASAPEEPAAEEAMSLDFDLDLGAPPAESPTETAAETAETEAGLDFDVGMPAAQEAAPEAAPGSAEADAAAGDPHALDFEFDLGEAEKPTTAEAPAEPLAGMPALDLSAISLELGESEVAPAETPADQVPAEETLPEIELPAIETPAIETPAIETPAFEVPAIETPAVETPAVETPAAEEPVIESPAAEVPAAVLDDPEVATKLELAQAYEEMGDKEGARELLYEVLNEGSPAQQEAARVKLAQLG